MKEEKEQEATWRANDTPVDDEKTVKHTGHEGTRDVVDGVPIFGWRVGCDVVDIMQSLTEMAMY